MIWRRAWSGFSFNAPECFLVSDGEMEKRWHGAGTSLAVLQIRDKYAKLGLVDILFLRHEKRNLVQVFEFRTLEISAKC